jgi:ABC-type sugar transport system permease subunit
MKAQSRRQNESKRAAGSEFRLQPSAVSLSRRVWQLQHRFAPQIFISPFVILLAIFLLYPLTRSLILSTYSTAGGPKEEKFIGLGNYRFLLQDRLFWGATLNTIVFAVGLVTFQIPLSLALAMLLNSASLRCRDLFRFIFFSTYLVGGVVGAIIFSMLLDTRHGLLNESLSFVLRRTIEIDWLGEPNLAMVSILMAALWLSVGFGMIYLLAGLQAVDLELYDAANMDGADAWQRFIHITLPELRGVLGFLIVVGTIGAFQLFELPYVLFRQNTGPAGRGLTVVMYLFLTGFQAGDLGYAAAIGWMLVVLIFIVSLIQIRFLRLHRTR